MTDYFRTWWPDGLKTGEEAVARRVDALNDSRSDPAASAAHAYDALVAALRAAHADAPLVTFSHFVPRVELSPEKRFLYLPPLGAPPRPLATGRARPTPAHRAQPRRSARSR